MYARVQCVHVRLTTHYLLHEVLILFLTWLLHPIEVLAYGVFELEDKHTTRLALRHTLELSVTRENDQILRIILIHINVHVALRTYVCYTACFPVFPIEVHQPIIQLHVDKPFASVSCDRCP